METYNGASEGCTNQQVNNVLSQQMAQDIDLLGEEGTEYLDTPDTSFVYDPKEENPYG